MTLYPVMVTIRDKKRLYSGPLIFPLYYYQGAGVFLRWDGGCDLVTIQTAHTRNNKPVVITKSAGRAQRFFSSHVTLRVAGLPVLKQGAPMVQPLVSEMSLCPSHITETNPK